MNTISEQILVIIPHSGDDLPIEIEDDDIKESVSDDLYIEMDVGTDVIYDFRDKLGNNQILFPIHRGIIDPNGDPDHLDDSIPVKTIFDHDIYRKKPSNEFRKDLLAQYHTKFHDYLSQQAEKCLMIFDSHSTQVGDKDDFGDRFDSDIAVANKQINVYDGKVVQNTCDDDLLNYYAEALEKELDGKYNIGINTKYLVNTYGYIEGRYGQSKNELYSKPVLLQEINEAMYTDEHGNFDTDEMEFLRISFAKALKYAAESYFGTK